MAANKTLLLATGLAMLGLVALPSCGGGNGEKKTTSAPAKATAAKKGASKADKPYEPKNEALKGEGLPSVLLAQAWFMKDANGKPKPGPARIQIWQQTPEGWQASILEDGDSNVFHKIIVQPDGSLLTIGAEEAALKRWTYADGKWSDDLLWTKEWGGKFNRIRDIEIGDVDNDGKDEYVMATHDGGVVAVYNPPEDGKAAEVIELDARPDTFVHEIEIGDVDGDGKLEFFATPSDRNKANQSQQGHLQMYKWDGTTYQSTTIDPMGETHAKEILVVDIDKDGKDDLFSVLEAETGPNKEIVAPVEIRRYTLQPDGTFTHSVVATINDRQTRFLVPGDFDGDGDIELVAAAMKTGLYFIDPHEEDGETKWTIKRFDSASSGFEHATWAADLDGDGKLELYVAGDDQRELKKYVWNDKKQTFDGTLLARLNKDTITWYVTTAKL